MVASPLAVIAEPRLTTSVNPSGFVTLPFTCTEAEYPFTNIAAVGLPPPGMSGLILYSFAATSVLNDISISFKVKKMAATIDDQPAVIFGEQADIKPSHINYDSLLIKPPGRSFAGFQLLLEYFAFPEKSK